MKRLYNDFTTKDKSDLLELYFYRQVQINDLVDIFHASSFIISKIISEEIQKRQEKKEDE